MLVQRWPPNGREAGRADVPGQIARESTLVAHSARNPQHDRAGHLILPIPSFVRPQLSGPAFWAAWQQNVHMHHKLLINSRGAGPERAQQSVN